MKSSNNLPVGCVLMAAGDSKRFGRNKLLQKLGGITLIERAIESIPSECLADVAVVTQYDEIAVLAHKYGFNCIINRHPELGASHTVKIGTQALKNTCSAIMYQVADQPKLRRESVAALVDFYRRNSENIVAASFNGVKGNPCIFPSRYFNELCSLVGDRGGSAVIKAHPDVLKLFEIPEIELADVDTQAAFDELNKHI